MCGLNRRRKGDRYNQSKVFYVFITKNKKTKNKTKNIQNISKSTLKDLSFVSFV